MTDGSFDIDAELAKKDAEVRAAAIESDNLRSRLSAWQQVTGAIDQIRLHRMGDSVSEAFTQFVSRGGKIREDRVVWLPPEHPEYGKVALDATCMRVPPLRQVRDRDEKSPYSAEIRHKEWDKACAEARARVAEDWDSRFQRPGCLEFVDWDFEGSHKYGWVVFDQREEAAYIFHDHRGSYTPGVDEIRTKLVDTLYYQTRQSDIRDD